MKDFFNKVNKNHKNLWRYENFYPQKFSPTEQLFIEDSFSPLIESNYLPNIELYLKREDNNITGSLKTRGMAYQLAVAKKENNKFVISTSGNAGLTASQYLKKYNGEIIVITSKDIPLRKINALKSHCNNLLISTNPPHTANYISKKYNYKNLRPSKDENSIYGYYSLGFEIFEQLHEAPDHLFTYATSGSSFLGIYDSFKTLEKLGEIDKIPAMYAVRKEGITTYRNKEILEICTKTGGKIINISRQGHDSETLNTSYEGRCTLNAIRQIKPDGTVIGILTGRKYNYDKSDINTITSVKNLQDIDNYMQKIKH